MKFLFPAAIAVALCHSETTFAASFVSQTRDLSGAWKAGSECVRASEPRKSPKCVETLTPQEAQNTLAKGSGAWSRITIEPKQAMSKDHFTLTSYEMFGTAQMSKAIRRELDDRLQGPAAR
jgi:hypothetical protein